MVNLRKREKMPTNVLDSSSSSSLSDSKDGAPSKKRMKLGSPSKGVTKEIPKASTASPSASPSTRMKPCSPSKEVSKEMLKASTASPSASPSKDEAVVEGESHVNDSEHEEQVKKAAKGKGVLQDTPTFSTQVSEGFEEFVNPKLIEVMKEHDRTDSQDSEFEDTQLMYSNKNKTETNSDDDFQDPPPKEYRKQGI